MERNKIIFVNEKNELMFQSTLQNIFDELSNEFNIEVQYEPVYKKNNAQSDTFYTALVIARRK